MSETDDQRTRRVLREHGLPDGLLPEGIIEGDVADDGRFWVQLPKTVERNHGGYRVRFQPRISGTISHGTVRDLEGVHAKQMLWLAVARITAVGSTHLNFHVGQVTVKLATAEFPFAG